MEGKVKPKPLNSNFKNLAKNIKHNYKPKDNYDSNKAKVKKELMPSRPRRDDKSAKIKEELKAKDLPSHVIIKLVSMEGEELGNETSVPIQTSVYDLNLTMNKLKKTQAPDLAQSYIFRIGNLEIKSTLEDTLTKHEEALQGEKAVMITYCPESLFNVKPLTRAGTTLEGHTDSILAVKFSPDGKHLASGGGDTEVRFWDTDTETPLFSSNDNEKKASHASWVLVVEFSPCSTMLASGDVNGSFIVWNPVTGMNITRMIKAHSKYITSISWKPLHLDEDCKFLCTTGKDGFLKIWNVQTQTCHLVINAHTDTVSKCIWSGDNLIYTAGHDMLVKAWDAQTGEQLKTMKGHAHWVNTLTINTEYTLRCGYYNPEEPTKVNTEFTPISRGDMFKSAIIKYKKLKETVVTREKIVTGSEDFTLILWDPTISEKPVCRMTGHQALVNHVAFSPDTFYLASASFDKCIKVWNGHTGAFLFNFRGHVGPVYQIAFSPDSKLLLSGSKDSTLKCWNLKTKRLMHELPGHADEVYTVDWSPSGEKAVSGSKDQRLRIWKH